MSLKTLGSNPKMIKIILLLLGTVKYAYFLSNVFFLEIRKYLITTFLYKKLDLSLFCTKMYTLQIVVNKFLISFEISIQVVRVAGHESDGHRIESCQCPIYLCFPTYFLLHGKDKFPLDEGYESKFTLEVRIWLAAHTCRSGIGPSPADSGG